MLTTKPIRRLATGRLGAYETCAFASLLSDNAPGGGLVHAEIVRFAMADEPAPSADEPLPIPNLLPLTARGPPVS